MSYRETRADQRIADDHLAVAGTCSFCGCGAEWETLGQFGSRCGTCFTQYCTGGKRNPPMPTREEMTAVLRRLRTVLCGNSQGPRAWAYKMKAREESGETLSRPQRDAWRVAIPEASA